MTRRSQRLFFLPIYLLYDSNTLSCFLIVLWVGVVLVNSLMKIPGCGHRQGDPLEASSADDDGGGGVIIIIVVIVVAIMDIAIGLRQQRL